jgi:hypothetical protein
MKSDDDARPLADPGSALIFVTSDAANDVLGLLKAAARHQQIKLAETGAAALGVAQPGDTIFFVADFFPHVQTEVPPSFWRLAAAKKVKVVLEFPATLPINTSFVLKKHGRNSTPCLPREVAQRTSSVAYTYVNHDHNLCSDGHKEVHTHYRGVICNRRDDIQWQHMFTTDPVPGLTPAQCNWTEANSVEYSGHCGVAPVQMGKPPCPGNNASALVPVWLCPPSGFDRTPTGGMWSGGQLYGDDLDLEQCAAACNAKGGCKGFAVSDDSGCKLFSELKDFTPAASTSSFMSTAELPPPPPPPPPPEPTPITLQRWTTLRPSTGAQPTPFRGVLAPRMPPAVEAAWMRVGLKPLDLVDHYATESTMPSSWRVYSTYCQHIPVGEQDLDLDCTLERTAGVFVHAYSTVVAGFARANFGIDTLTPPVVKNPSAAGAGNVPLLYELNNISGLPTRVLVAATKISDLIKHRFAPRDHWSGIWRYILEQFAEIELRLPMWTPAVGPSYALNTTLPPTFRRDAIIRATDWFFTPRGPVACDPMPCSHVWDGHTSCSSTSAGMSMIYTGEVMCGTLPWLPQEVKDAAMCVIEGTNGVVFHNGSQQMLAGDRSDCNAEGAMAAAVRAAVEAQPGGDKNKSAHFAKVAKKLLTYVFVLSGAQINSSYVSWGHMKEYASMGTADGKAGPRVPAPLDSDFYSDDNSRDNMGGIAALNLLHKFDLLESGDFNTSVYDTKLVTLGLALLRTTGTDGYRPANINGQQLNGPGGWHQFFDHPQRSQHDNVSL